MAAATISPEQAVDVGKQIMKVTLASSLKFQNEEMKLKYVGVLVKQIQQMLSRHQRADKIE